MLHTRVNSLLKTNDAYTFVLLLYKNMTPGWIWRGVKSWRREAPGDYSSRLLVRVPLFQLCIKLSPHRWRGGKPTGGLDARGLDRKCSTERKPPCSIEWGWGLGEQGGVTWSTFAWGITSQAKILTYNLVLMPLMQRRKDGGWNKKSFQYKK